MSLLGHFCHQSPEIITISFHHILELHLLRIGINITIPFELFCMGFENSYSFRIHIVLFSICFYVDYIILCLVYFSIYTYIASFSLGCYEYAVMNIYFEHMLSFRLILKLS